jgi:hypothetical protein
MAYGQIDPARLDGDALTRWYLRSPADIEQERQASAAQSYNDFFGNTDGSSDGLAATTDGQSPDDDPSGSPVPMPSGVPQRLPSSDADSGDDSYLDGGVYYPGQDDAQKTPVANTVWNCPTCHGRFPIPIPPQLLPLQPLFRDIPPSSGGASTPEPYRDRHPQCEMQERQDRGICAQQPTAPAKAVCNASATDRRVWCDQHAGEIGSPDLITAYRKDGRRWP